MLTNQLSYIKNEKTILENVELCVCVYIRYDIFLL